MMRNGPLGATPPGPFTETCYAAEVRRSKRPGFLVKCSPHRGLQWREDSCKKNVNRRVPEKKRPLSIYWYRVMKVFFLFFFWVLFADTDSFQWILSPLLGEIWCPSMPIHFSQTHFKSNGTHNNHGFSMKNGDVSPIVVICLLNTSPFLPLNHDLCRAPHARSFEMTDTLTAYDVKEMRWWFFASTLRTWEI